MIAQRLSSKPERPKKYVLRGGARDMGEKSARAACLRNSPLTFPLIPVSSRKLRKLAGSARKRRLHSFRVRGARAEVLWFPQGRKKYRAGERRAEVSRYSVRNPQVPCTTSQSFVPWKCLFPNLEEAENQTPALCNKVPPTIKWQPKGSLSRLSARRQRETRRPPPPAAGSWPRTSPSGSTSAWPPPSSPPTRAAAATTAASSLVWGTPLGRAPRSWDRMTRGSSPPRRPQSPLMKTSRVSALIKLTVKLFDVLLPLLATACTYYVYFTVPVCIWPSTFENIDFFKRGLSLHVQYYDLSCRSENIH